MPVHRNLMQRLLACIIQERIDARARNVVVPGWHDSSYVLPIGESYGSSEEMSTHASGVARPTGWKAWRCCTTMPS